MKHKSFGIASGLREEMHSLSALCIWVGHHLLLAFPTLLKL